MLEKILINLWLKKEAILEVIVGVLCIILESALSLA
jgi:hypothetical protein